MPLHVGKREPDAREQLDPADSAGTRLRPGRGRHPSDHVRASILAAAGRVLLEEGLAAFTIERVAAQAGASKTTIYKWWASRGALAFDGFFNALEATLAFPDTGDVEHDLVTQMQAFIHLITQKPAGRVLAELIGQAQTDPDLSKAFLSHYVEPRRRLAVEAMQRAQTRGQLHADVDLEVAVDQLWGPATTAYSFPFCPSTSISPPASCTTCCKDCAPTHRRRPRERLTSG